MATPQQQESIEVEPGKILTFFARMIYSNPSIIISQDTMHQLIFTQKDAILAFFEKYKSCFDKEELKSEIDSEIFQIIHPFISSQQETDGEYDYEADLEQDSEEVETNSIVEDTDSIETEEV